MEREEGGEEELPQYANQSSFWQEQLKQIVADLKEIADEESAIKFRQKELAARRAVLKEAQTNARRKLASVKKHAAIDPEVVARDELGGYVNRYLDKMGSGGMQGLADSAGVSLASVERIRYKKGSKWISFTLADQLLAAMDLAYLLDRGDIAVHQRRDVSRLTDD